MSTHYVKSKAKQLIQFKITVNANGFSFVELMVVVSIIAIMAAFASLGIDIIQRERVSSATKDLYSDLQAARMEGMVTGPTGSLPNFRGVGIRFESPVKYVYFKFNDDNQNYTYENGEEVVGASRTVTLPSSIAIQRLDSGALVNPANVIAGDVQIFDKFGIPRAFDWSVISNYTLVVKHQSAGYSKCIVVDTNSIREGAWDGSSNNCTLK